jgi:hypothetical protein
MKRKEAKALADALSIYPLFLFGVYVVHRSKFIKKTFNLTESREGDFFGGSFWGECGGAYLQFTLLQL